ncbi:MAG: hypothetical protein U0X76_01235 [Bacteroidia bacterium]
MKKILTSSLIILLLTISGVKAQGGGGGQGRGKMRPDKDKIEALKIGFLTDRLSLTPEEARQFWPVYNKYQDELEALRKSRRDNILNDNTSLETMSDADLEKMVDNELAFHQSELDILKKYHPQFKKILPIRKVAMLYRAEEDFKRHLLELIREKRREAKRPG